MFKVKKRDGRVIPFDIIKVSDAVQKAIEEVGSKLKEMQQ